MSTATSKNTFRKTNLLTIVLLFVLILAGGIVRSTGSGMGCPDWPKCFSGYIPPINVANLPKNYKQQYVAGRIVKNQKFANTLDVFGFSDLAQRIRTDRSILVPEDFNVTKAWTEYINRLIGLLSGLAVFFTALFSFSYARENVRIVVLSILNVFLIWFQAWLGGIVVSSNLVAWIVTVHMLVALAILAICISTYYMAKVYNKKPLNTNAIVHVVALLVLILSIVQIAFGSEVRETIDAVSNHLQNGYRNYWITGAGMIFIQHRDIAILVLTGNVVLFALIRGNFGRHSIQQQIMSFTLLVIMLQMVTGILLSYWALPPFAQCAHLVLASLLFGAQFYLLLNLYKPVSIQGARP